ncbi:cold-regulated 413 plasma membrane protein 2-like [Silene latifolia]|uniref:cold-regulated 413 plasma membrane protein 2-like n=1 Tax=Silene latifolia TaxID=37657 RepID=UPI003D778759
MKQVEFLRMKTEDATSNDQMNNNVKKLASHTIKLGSLGVGTLFFQWLASIAAIYLLILDHTNWKTNILTGLLVPYIFFSLPLLPFMFLRGEIGMWVAFITVVLRVFFPRQFPDWLELPGAIILIIVVAPSLLAETVRGTALGAAVCLVIGCYLLQEHVRASGGFKKSFTKANGLSNTLGILLLLAYPLWYFVVSFF